jgi:xylulokinase
MKAIGLSGQMHAAVLLDRHNRPIRPAILWNDGRAHAEADELQRRIPGIGEIAGVLPMAGFTAPKLLWLKTQEPHSFAAIAKILLPKDYVRLQMTGSFATDMCDAAGSLLFDTGQRQWSKEIVAACGLPPQALPQALEGNAISGHLREGIARDWGLAGRIAVAAGAGDAAAGAIGIGAVNDGDGFISLGTSAQYLVTSESYRPAPASLIHTFCHGLPGRWFRMAALLNGASCLNWVAGVLGERDIGKLLREVEAAFAGPSPLIFLPYLSGERTPHNDPHAKGVFLGLTPSTRREDMVLAVMEGVALALADCQTYLAGAGSLPPEPGVIGGGSKSNLWMKILAAVLDRPLVLYEGGEAGPAWR